jgi:cytochrome c oxidase subunit 4
VTAETLASHDAPHEAHPNRDRTYVIVALVLAAVTGLETLTYFVDFKRAAMPILLVCMGFKFYMIAAYFMHLKWDRPTLRRVFMTGIAIAVIVYIVALTDFQFWNGTDYMPK